MPIYQSPEFEALKKSADSLSTQYKGTEEKRLESIERIQTIAALCPTQDSQNAMLGGMTLDMDEIIATHRITSPQVKTYGIITPNSRIDSFLKKVVPSSLLFSTGSTYNELLRTALNLSSQNEMDKFHRLIYAGALNTLTEKPPTDDVLSN
jgi:hypothetical protein